jgi:hypothetical protein
VVLPIPGSPANKTTPSCPALTSGTSGVLSLATQTRTNFWKQSCVVTSPT